MNTQNVSSPFHEGEREIQTRLGVRDQVEDLGSRVILHYLPDQHREFYQQLPYLALGSVDAEGRPWASMVFGEPGFIHSPDQHTLIIDSVGVVGDPLQTNLEIGSRVGALGIMYGIRRRNRLTAKVTKMTDRRITLWVEQSFGNCPQYIQAREVLSASSKPEAIIQPQRLEKLSSHAKEIINQADHFFIATAYSEDPDDLTQGTDVSHRGGKPGFVRIDDDHTLTFPDFTGNFHFNTLGNILKNPVAGLLFMNFDNGDMLHLTCRADIIWDNEEKRAFTGAERLVQFSIVEGQIINNAIPVKWDFINYSPNLEYTGSWEEVAQKVVDHDHDQAKMYENLTVTKIMQESDVITSFYLQNADRTPVRCHRAGQFLPIEIDIPEQETSVRRTYTISNAPNQEYYRLSIKREAANQPENPPGLVSNHFHADILEGSVIRTLEPRGQFVLSESTKRPVVLISAGVGITPMISMLEQLLAEQQTCGGDRKIWFIHGARNGDEHAFIDHVDQLKGNCNNLTVHYAYSAPTEGDVARNQHHSIGRVDGDLLQSQLPLGDYDFYFCGPTGFMQSIYGVLTNLNISDDRIHYEFFGPGSVLHKGQPGQSAGLVGDIENTNPTRVVFAKSDKEAIWEPSKGSLLDLAESVGLQPAYSCRSGVCATCETKVLANTASYTEPPLVDPQDGFALICCSYPKVSDKDMVLDL